VLRAEEFDQTIPDWRILLELGTGFLGQAALRPEQGSDGGFLAAEPRKQSDVVHNAKVTPD
jgi:hypothetical protein